MGDGAAHDDHIGARGEGFPRGVDPSLIAGSAPLGSDPRAYDEEAGAADHPDEASLAGGRDDAGKSRFEGQPGQPGDHLPGLSRDPELAECLLVGAREKGDPEEAESLGGRSASGLQGGPQHRRPSERVDG